jgi:hypothetical protein
VDATSQKRKDGIGISRGSSSSSVNNADLGGIDRAHRHKPKARTCPLSTRPAETLMHRKRPLSAIAATLDRSVLPQHVRGIRAVGAAYSSRCYTGF